MSVFRRRRQHLRQSRQSRSQLHQSDVAVGLEVGARRNYVRCTETERQLLR